MDDGTYNAYCEFQSTPSVKRVTYSDGLINNKRAISIHTLCEEGDYNIKGCKVCFQISIHTLCEEGDGLFIHSERRKTISIHTLCEEGD